MCLNGKTSTDYCFIIFINLMQNKPNVSKFHTAMILHLLQIPYCSDITDYLCGRLLNPGGDQNGYFISTVPNAGPEFSSHNWLSNLTSDQYLCNLHELEQRDAKDSAGLENDNGIGVDFGLKYGLPRRIHFNNYVKR